MASSTSMVIWVIDDEEQMRSLYMEYLAHLGYGVVGFASPEEAVKRLKLSTHPNDEVRAVLSDVCMHPVTGVQGMNALHQIDPSLPVLLMSSLPQSETAKQGSLSGACAYLQKPFPLKSLACALDCALRRS